MGSLYRHCRGACGYEVDVSGEIDGGFAAKTATVTCATCKALFDVVFSEEPWEEGPDLKDAELRCPKETGKKHDVRPWQAKGPCPRCGQAMRRGGQAILLGMVKLAIACALCVTSVTASSVARADDPDPWISRDKALHFDVSAGIAAAGYGVSAAWLVDHRWEALAIGGGAALGAGAAKELIDLAGLGDPSWKDFAWDAIGAVVGLAIAWGVDLALSGIGHRPAGVFE